MVYSKSWWLKNRKKILKERRIKRIAKFGLPKPIYKTDISVRKMSKLEASYIAGILDGEGSISMVSSPSGIRPYIEISVSNKFFMSNIARIIGCPYNATGTRQKNNRPTDTRRD